jgi:hypothetical protein
MCSGRVKVHDRLKQVPEMWFGRDGVLAPPAVAAKPSKNLKHREWDNLPNLHLTAR